MAALLPVCVTAQDDELRNGLVAYYPFDNDAKDASGKGNNGKVQGATLQDGKFGKCYYFGGYDKSSIIKVPNNNSLKFDNAMSISLWFKVDNYTGMDGWGKRTSSPIMCLSAKDFDRGALFNTISCSNDNKFSVGLGIDNKSVSAEINSSAREWHHAVFVVTRNSLKIYIDGTLAAQKAETISFSIANNRDLCFGRFSSTWYPFMGWLDEIRVYNRELNSDEVETLYDNSFEETPMDAQGVIAVEYRDTKLLDNEPDYKLYEDQLNIGINGYTFCEATHKMYFLDGISTVVEYDYSNAMNKQVARRSFQLPFAVEMNGGVIEVSPNGTYLASVDEDGAALHIISIASGSEIATAPLGEKYKNIIKKNGKDVSWHPLHFISDNEVLVSGTAYALLYDINKKKGKKLSFKKPYNQTPKYVVKPSGRISGYTTSPLQFVTFEVTNGKLSAPIPGTYYNVAYWGLYHTFKNNSWSDWTLHDEKTGARVDNQLEFSDRTKYKFNWSIEIRPKLYIQTLSDPQVQLYFPNMQWFDWHDNHNLLIVWTTDRKVQIFNHTLTGNEMEKQHLQAIADKGAIAAFDNFLSQYPNSRYTNVAKQKRIECIEGV